MQGQHNQLARLRTEMLYLSSRCRDNQAAVIALDNLFVWPPRRQSMSGKGRNPLQESPVAIRELRVAVLTRDMKHAQTAAMLGEFKLEGRIDSMGPHEQIVKVVMFVGAPIHL
jgi:hypothetical protein